MTIFKSSMKSSYNSFSFGFVIDESLFSPIPLSYCVLFEGF